MQVAGPFDRHPEWTAAAFWLWAHAHRAPDSARRRRFALGNGRAPATWYSGGSFRTRPTRVSRADRPQSYVRSYAARARGGIRSDRAIRARGGALGLRFHAC